MSPSKRYYKKGFTLVELLVTISIFAILTGVVIFNQGRFNSTILLTNLAYDTALTIRQAQNYGINVKEFNNGASGFYPYGVHFDMDNPKSFILFADTSYTANDPGDGLYASGGGLVDLSTCQAEEGCVKRYNIKSGNHIEDICSGEAVNGVCGLGQSHDTVDVVFKRPNPDALIRFDSDTNIQPLVTIILSSGDNSNTKEVIVQSNGLIQVGD